MSNPGLIVEDLPGGIRCLSLSNPQKSNALDDVIVEQLAEAIATDKTSHVRAFLLRSAGPRTFCSGYDLAQLEVTLDQSALPDDRLGEVFRLLSTHPAPSVALVQGPAYGAGFELAASCDFRVGSPTARFCMPPARLGVVYSAAGISRVSQLVGLGRARHLFLTSVEVPAHRALEIGLLDELQVDAEDAATKLVEKLATMAPLAISGMKKTFDCLGAHLLSDGELSDLRRLRSEAFNSQDLKEGRRAFLEKTKPSFKGK